MYVRISLSISIDRYPFYIHMPFVYTPLQIMPLWMYEIVHSLPGHATADKHSLVELKTKP